VRLDWFYLLLFIIRRTFILRMAPVGPRWVGLKGKQQIGAQTGVQSSSLPPRPTPRMGSKTSKAKRPAVIIPQDVVDEILDHLAADSNFESLRACALVSRSWIPSCRRYLFHTADLTRWKMNRWLNAFPVPEESPAHHVRDLRISIEWSNWFHDKFLEHAPWFTNVQRLYLLGGGGDYLGSRLSSLWRLPESITSLTVDASYGVTLAGIWDIMARLPNLNDLSLRGFFIPADRRELLEIGTVPRGGIGGELVLPGVHGNAVATKMMLEILTGSPFSKVEITCAHEYMPLIIRLVEACSKTVVKLTLNVIFNGEYHPFSWSG